jgi:hypothetical protein
MKSANKEMFAPRGPMVKIMSTKKMVAAVGCQNVDAKGKLALPPLGVLDNLTPSAAIISYQDYNSGPSGEGKVGVEVEDPRMRRLRALEGFIAPLEFEKDPAPTRGAMDKYGGAPLRWLNKKQDTEFQKAASKSVEHRRKHSSAVEGEFRNSEAEIEVIEQRMREITVGAEKGLEGMGEDRRYEVEARMEIELEELEGRKERVERERDERVREVYKKGDKKLEKLAGKEEKIANRILWIVVMKMGGNVGDELVDVGSLEG